MSNFKNKTRWINTLTVWEFKDGEYVEVHNEGFEYDGDLAQAGAADTYEDAYRFYDSANTTPIDAQDTNTTLEVDTTYVLRLRIYNAGTKDEDSTVFQLERENTTQATGVANVTASSTHVQTADATGLTNGSAVTAGTLTGAAGDFINGEQVEDGTPATLVIVQQDYTEMHYAFTIVSGDVNDGDTILLTANCPNNPSVTATITVNKVGTDVLTADDVESATNVTPTPSLGQEHALTANDVESASNVTPTPSIAIVTPILADDVESATNVTPTPSIGQVHALTNTSVESATNVTPTPAIGQDHQLLANDVESASEVSTPTLSESAPDNLLADDVESLTTVTPTPALGQEHALLANDVESASTVTPAPALGQIGSDNLLADDVESLTTVTPTPSLGQDHQLLADDVESATEVTSNTLGQVHGLTAGSVESATNVTPTPSIAIVNILAANDVESASEVTSNTLGQEHALLANDVESASEVTSPNLTQQGTIALLANDVESASEVSQPGPLPAADGERPAGGWVDPYAQADKLRDQAKPKKAKKKAKKSLPTAVKIGSYTQTKDIDEYTLKEAENALKQLKQEQVRAEQERDEEVLLKILLHIRCFEDRCREIEEQDIAFIIAMLAA